MDYRQNITPITAYTKPELRGRGIKGHVAFYESIFGLRAHAYQDEYPPLPHKNRPAVSLSTIVKGDKLGGASQAGALGATCVKPQDCWSSDSPSTCSCSASQSHECKSETVARIVGLPNHGKAKIKVRGDDEVILKRTEWLDYNDQFVTPPFTDETDCHYDPSYLGHEGCHQQKTVLQRRLANPRERVYMDPKMLSSVRPRPSQSICLGEEPQRKRTTLTPESDPTQAQQIEEVSELEVLEEEEELEEEVEEELEEEVEEYGDEEEELEDGLLWNEEVCAREGEEEEEADCSDCEVGGKCCCEVISEEFGVIDEPPGPVQHHDESVENPVETDWLGDDPEDDGEFDWAPIESVDVLTSNGEHELLKSAGGSARSSARGRQASEFRPATQISGRRHATCMDDWVTDLAAPPKSRGQGAGDQWVPLSLGKKHGHTHRIRFS